MATKKNTVKAGNRWAVQYQKRNENDKNWYAGGLYASREEARTRKANLKGARAIRIVDLHAKK